MTPSSICIVQLGRLGDFILTTPMFRAIKSAYPSCVVSVLVEPNCIPLARAHPDIDNVLVYEKSLAGTVRVILQLRGSRFDYWIDPKDHASVESRVFVRLARSSHTIGFNDPKKRRLFKTDIVPEPQQRTLHAVDRNLRALKVLDIADGDRRPSLPTDPGCEVRLKKWCTDHGISEYTCVNISAGTLGRMWPEEHWNQFVGRVASANRPIVLISSVRDATAVARIVRAGPFAYHYPTLTIVDACSVVHNAAMVVSPDTSIIHLAAAFDTPVLGLYPDTEANFMKFHPLSTVQRVVRGTQVAAIPVNDVESAYRELAIP